MTARESESVSGAVSQTSSKPQHYSLSEAIPVAAEGLRRTLADGRPITRDLIRDRMTDAVGSQDSDGTWGWKDGYDALECALVLHLRAVLERSRGTSETEILGAVKALSEGLPTHTIRSKESEALQQFSTPIPVGYVASVAAAVNEGDRVLESSGGTGLLAVFAEATGGGLILNEISPRRKRILQWLFPHAEVFGHNAEYIDDLLRADIRPTVALLNPPFTASPRMRGRATDVTQRHLGSALSRLEEGGRLVAITAHWFSPDDAVWRDLFVRWQRSATVRLSVPLPGSLYAKHGTWMGTRLTVIDKIPAEHPEEFPACREMVGSVDELLEIVLTIPRRGQVAAEGALQKAPRTPSSYLPLIEDSPLFRYAPEVFRVRTVEPAVSVPFDSFGTVCEIAYQEKAWSGRREGMTSGLYESYEPQVLSIPGAAPHPTPLVESVAMASVAPSMPTYRPFLPQRVLQDGLLSEVQLESVIFAGEAHSQFLGGRFEPDPSLDFLTRCDEGREYRRGWSLGDGTGVGKGRQVAGIILDNWLKGRRRAIWISASDKLIEDARRDWAAVGGSKDTVVSLSTFKQGTEITLTEGILFVTYATLRSGPRENKAGRVEQILAWCGPEFDGVIVFDEAHMMRHAASKRTERGIREGSRQGIAGLRLQNGLPNARVVYVSATGATEIDNLAYAQRLGLWQTDDVPFDSQGAFVAAMEAGGITASEVLTRDLKTLGLYMSRTLSFEGVEYDILEHELTEAQKEMYNAYAAAYQVIHQNLRDALKVTNIVSFKGGTRDKNVKATAMSAFEGNKQRFFNHLLTSLKCPTLIRAIEGNLEDGHAVVIQVVSTNEALLERRLSEIPPAEWGDIQVDITPREYVMDYLMHAFPCDLYEVYTDEKGKERTRPMVGSDGTRVKSRDALRMRDKLIERLSLIPPVPGALDQLIHHFGYEAVAEVTGRSRRIVREVTGGEERLFVQNRPASANLTEADAFQSDEKRILVFSEAGGVGRSYHADRGAKNHRRRIHYLLESGWRADSALQGLGRTNRTNQVTPPVFRPVTTDVKGERRFVSTIARRLDSLGALTRGQRQTGGQGLFRPEDNLESPYARAALRQFFGAFSSGRVRCCSLKTFEEVTGLSLRDEHGRVREELPPMSQFLNRLLALEIGLQNALFGEIEALIEDAIESAIEGGTYEVGVETLRADGLRVLDRQELYRHARTGGVTSCLKIEMRTRNSVLSADDALTLRNQEGAEIIHNERSGNVAVSLPAPSMVDTDGSIIERRTLVRPKGRERVKVQDLERSFWKPIERRFFASLWRKEAAELAEYDIRTFYLISGLLLPIWDKLPRSSPRVYCLHTDDGERIIGRFVQPEELASVLRALNSSLTVQVTGLDIERAILERRQVVQVGPWLLRSVYVMGGRRIEVLGKFDSHAIEKLVAQGCFTEMIRWVTRVFIPISDAATVIDRLQQVPPAP